MGLTKQSVGMGAVDSGLEIKKQTPEDKVIAIAGILAIPTGSYPRRTKIRL